MFEEFRDKVIVITGATSGIGYEAALVFANVGAHVVIAGRNENSAQTLVDTITQLGNKALFIKTDVAKSSSVKNLIEQAHKHFGRINYAFNCAGIEGKVGTQLSAYSEEEFDEMMQTNLKGIWLCMKFQIPTIAKSGGGAIVNVSSILTQMAIEGTGIYTASKAGVEALTRVAAIEAGPLGIRINAIGPGATDTPMIRRIYADMPEELSELSTRNPLKKIASPKEIANTALFLCSSLASHINGDIIHIDGGSYLT